MDGDEFAGEVQYWGKGEENQFEEVGEEDEVSLSLE